MIPATAPPEARVSLGRSNAVVTFALLGFLGLLVGVAGYGAATADYFLSRIISLVLAAVFAIPLAMLLFALPRFLSPRYVIVDPGGLRIQHGNQQVALAWPQLVAVGIGYELAAPESPGLPPGSIQEIIAARVSDQAAEALHVSGKRRIALEIYPARPDAGQWFPKLQPYWKALAPPVAGVPPYGWRFPLPPVVSIAQDIDRGLWTFQRQRRLGWIPRPWSG